MRLRSISATAFAAFAALQPLAWAQAHPIDTDSVQAAPNDVVQEGAIAIAYTSSATTTHTLTRTVMRVVQTEYATRNVSVSSATATPSLSLTGYGNGTVGAFGSSSTAIQSAKPMVPTGAASHLGLDVVGKAAVVGVVGLFLV
ncbi:hypothetical protein LTR27_005169 [Elasticomyces elasticus]|nr:hypothetical protein LTR27_005169 [Elasticomyces elasticus]